MGLEATTTRFETATPEASTGNREVDTAAATLAASNPSAGSYFARNAPRLPTGIATTAAGAINGNPKAATGLFQGLQNGLGNGMQINGMNDLMKMIQEIMPQLKTFLSGIMGGKIFGDLNNSQTVAVMGSNPAKSLVADLKDAANTPDTVAMRSIDKATGAPGGEIGKTVLAGDPNAPAQNDSVFDQKQNFGMQTQPGMSPRGMA